MAGNYTGKRIAFIGDVHAFSGTSGYQHMVTDYIQINKLLDDIFILGDITYDAKEEEFQVIADWSDRWPAKVHMIMGNRDMGNKYLKDDNERTLYKQRFMDICNEMSTNYVITMGNCVFICISTDATTLAEKEATPTPSHYPDDGNMTEETLTFLTNALANNQDKNVFVCSHQPPYDVNQWTTERASNTYYNTTQLQELLSLYRVDIWFYAHCHYPYKNGVVDTSAPYDNRVPPEFRNIYPSNNAPRSAAPSKEVNGENTTVFVPCWGGNFFHGSTVIESRYIELHTGNNSIVIKARNHNRGIWQEIIPPLDYKVTLPYEIIL